MTSRLAGPVAIVLASLGCGGTPTEPVGPPQASVNISPPGVAIASVTEMTFVTPRDRSPQASYAWDFGDGATASGPTATHTYASDGNFTATVTVNTMSGTAMAAGTVSARTVTGLWRPDFFAADCFAILFTQVGSSIQSVAVSGAASSVSLQSPRSLTMNIGIVQRPTLNCGPVAQNRTGTFDGTLDSFTLVITPSQTDTWCRQ